MSEPPELVTFNKCTEKLEHSLLMMLLVGSFFETQSIIILLSHDIERATNLEKAEALVSAVARYLVTNPQNLRIFIKI